MRRTVPILGVLAALALAAGCGEGRTPDTAAPAQRTAGTSTQPPPAASRDPVALARSGLVRRTDLGHGWTASRHPRPDLRCSNRPYRGARAVVASDRFRHDETVVQMTVAAFPDAAASRRAYVRLNTPAALECLRRNSRRRMAEHVEGPPTRPRVIRIESLERWERAVRFTATAPSQIGLIDGLIDAIHLRVGAGIGALAIVSGPGPVTPEIYDEVVTALERRLGEAFG